MQGVMGSFVAVEEVDFRGELPHCGAAERVLE
jgi:hypothetical protein